MAPPSPPPLEGIRVLEAAHLIAGPFRGMCLGDLGADVVKVEACESADAGRTVYRAYRGGEGLLHLVVNRNKRGVCVDLRRPEGLAVFRRLAERADMIIEEFRGGHAGEAREDARHHPDPGAGAGGAHAGGIEGDRVRRDRDRGPRRWGRAVTQWTRCHS
ncbi:MAG: CoA transferase [Candidatus Rokubacteria bacterium]|nr:CoA transferase [Candidatus Rokubacteria bacterium]